MKAVGVEMNAALCEIQKHVIDNCGMGNGVAVLCSDIREQGDLLQTADIVIMNNVFCFFLPPQEQAIASSRDSSISAGFRCCVGDSCTSMCDRAH